MTSVIARGKIDNIVNNVNGIERPTGNSRAAGVEGQRIETSVTISKYKGPLPPPSYLREYNEIFPGAAEIILGMAQKEQEHRHIADIEEINRDRAEVEHEAKLNFLGVRSARLISVLFILASTFLIYTGNPITGSILGAGTLISLVSTFIYGTRKKNQKLQSDSSKTSSDMPS